MRGFSGAVVATAWAGSALFAIGLWIVAPQSAKTVPESALVLAVAVVPLALSIVVARAAPRNRAGALLAIAGFVVVATNLVDEAFGPWAGGWMLLYLPFAILLLVLPSGRTASRRWAAVGWTITGVVVAFIAVCALQWYVPDAAEPTTAPALALLGAFFTLLVACALAPILRYHHASQDERMQLRWIFLAGMSLPVTLLLCWTSYLIVGTADLVGFGLVLMYLAVPVGATIAIVRPGLFDIDRATLATVTATILSVGMLVVLSVACASAGVVLVQWNPGVAVGVLAALFGAAVLLFPLLQRTLERSLYPERGRALTALARLTSSVEAGAQSPAAVQEVLRDALRDTGLRIAVRGLADQRLVLLDGTPAPSTPATVLVRARGEQIGAIIPSPWHSARPPASVAHAAAPLIDAVRTDAFIASARSEVEASRERLLLAGYDERRRLERDLHDGAQQRLVALGMRLRVLQRTRTSDPATALALDGIVAELGTAVAELRRIAQGVRPSALDEGLGAALADLARMTDGIVHVDAQTPDLPDAVSVTAYYVASEAVANALRHAGATSIRITARERRGTLSVRVHDDGRGGAALTGSGGLRGLTDRVEAIGGVLTVDSRAGAGTTVEARLPCGS